MSKLNKLVFSILVMATLILLISCKLEQDVNTKTNKKSMDKEYIFNTPKEKLTARADVLFEIFMPNDNRDTSRSFIFNLYCAENGFIDTVFLEKYHEACNMELSEKLIEIIKLEKKVNPILHKGEPIQQYKVLISCERFRTVLSTGPLERP